MEATEIRLGNYYSDNGSVCRVTPSVIQEVYESKMSWCKPIPLSEDWLIKAGFKQIIDFKFDQYPIHPYWVKEGVCVFYNEGDLDNWLLGYAEMRLGQRCAVGFKWSKYVHQLQNAYYFITETELTFNQNQIK